MQTVWPCSLSLSCSTFGGGGGAGNEANFRTVIGYPVRVYRTRDAISEATTAYVSHSTKYDGLQFPQSDATESLDKLQRRLNFMLDVDVTTADWFRLQDAIKEIYIFFLAG